MARRTDVPTGDDAAVNASGWAVRDPSENVLALSRAANQRQDDLRDAERRYNDLRYQHTEEMSTLRAQFQEKLDAKESGRIDSILQVGREEVARTAAQANIAITTLAKQTTDLATTTAATVTTTASAAETRRSTDMAELNKRLSALELQLSASAGKQTVEDPRMERLTALVDQLARNNSQGTGKSEGISSTVAAIVMAIGVIATVITIYAFSQKAAAPTTYTPAPSGTVPATR